MLNNKTRWQNPFEKSLVEDWRLEEFPQNYREMVACFFPPEFMNRLESVDVKPKILMGGRGTGKSHILRMISIQSVINRIKFEKAKSEGKNPAEIKLKLEDYGEPYFGVYLKVTLFSPLSTTNITYLSRDELKSLFEHLFNMQASIAILDAVKFLIDVCEDIPREKEQILCVNLCKKLGQIIKGETLSDIKGSLSTQVEIIQKIVKEFPWHKDFSRFEGKIKFTSAPDFVRQLFGVIRNDILKDKVLFLLLDEYDELDEYQQEFINRLIRTRTLTFRIASKIGGIKTFEYTEGKELDEIHDYDPIIPLHFETSREKIHSYQNLLKNIFIRRLSVYGDYKINDPKKLLITPTLADEKITKKEIQEELKKTRASLKKKREITNPEDYWKNFEGHYKEAVIYRLLRKKGRDKLYAGFDEYVSLSSGIARQFILLCRDSFSLAHVRGIAIERGKPIPLRVQSEAVENLSRNLLLIETIKTIPSGYGPKLVRLIQDLGRILEAKLYWSTEPQANRFEIIDSQKFMNSEYSVPKEMIENGLRMPHFMSETAFRPKQPSYYISPFTFSLNGIFAPILGIPPEKRWRTPLNVDELGGLCSNENREEVLRKIIEQIKGKGRIVRGKKKQGKESVQLQRTIFDTLDTPISLSSCPVTGYGCNQNLISYMIQEGQLKAFLAAPFDKNSWTYDTRRWIKNAMSDHFQIRCVDVDDFPNVALILCKICSSVRQMPIGLFEITELNPNVIFELGMATALNKLNFILVYPDKIPIEHKKDYPPKPLSGIEYIPYELSENAIIKVTNEKILPTINRATKHRENQWCWVLRGKCPYGKVEVKPSKIFIGLPHDKNQAFFEEVEKLLKGLLSKYSASFFKPARSLNELCQLCREIRESSFCILDTTFNDITMLFALGVAFGKGKKFIQLQNTSLFPERPISDLRSWAVEYGNISELKEALKEELPKRLEGL
jgi:hypothetical protein